MLQRIFFRKIWQTRNILSKGNLSKLLSHLTMNYEFDLALGIRLAPRVDFVTMLNKTCSNVYTMFAYSYARLTLDAFLGLFLVTFNENVDGILN